MREQRTDDVEHGDGEWLNADIEASDANGPAVAKILSSVAQTLQEAPYGYRYDISLVVEERFADE